MKPLAQCRRMAGRHWREFYPQLAAELKPTGPLHERLLESEEKAEGEMDTVRRHLIQQGLTPQQVRNRAWEIPRERCVLIPPEEPTVTARRQSLKRCAISATIVSPTATRLALAP